MESMLRVVRGLRVYQTESTERVVGPASQYQPESWFPFAQFKLYENSVVVVVAAVVAVAAVEVLGNGRKCAVISSLN